MRLFIPALKTKLELVKPWDFGLYMERRNSSLIEAVGDTFSWGLVSDGPPYRNVMLPKGTIPVVDRIYIRCGLSKFDSVTFRVAACPNKDFLKARFWVKLDDANSLDAKVLC